MLPLWRSHSVRAAIADATAAAAASLVYARGSSLKAEGRWPPLHDAVPLTERQIQLRPPE